METVCLPRRSKSYSPLPGNWIKPGEILLPAAAQIELNLRRLMPSEILNRLSAKRRIPTVS
jgi:hypothetical protein